MIKHACVLCGCLAIPCAMQLINARGIIKDGQWIASVCKDLISELTRLHESSNLQVIGFVMDSASPNLKAYKLLHQDSQLITTAVQSQDADEEESDMVLQPMILLQCAAHTLSLLIKDITKAFPWVSETYRVAVDVSKTMHNNERVFDHYLRQCKESEPPVKLVSLPSFCETRFGSYHLVMRAVLAIMPVLRSMCNSDVFQEFAHTNKAARALLDNIQPGTSSSFRFRAPLVAELMDTIMKEMHVLEGDKAMLSAVIPMIRGLEEHVAEFAAAHPELCAVGMPSARMNDELDYALCGSDSESDDEQVVVEQSRDSLARLVQYRLGEFYKQDCMVAAYALDPANMVTSNKGASYNLPWNVLSNPDVNALAREVKRLGGQQAVVELQRIRARGIMFENDLDQAAAAASVAMMCAEAGEVATVAGIEERRGLWEQGLKSVYPKLAVVAAKLLSMHVTSCAAERNLSKFGRSFDKLRGRLLSKTAEKMVFVAQNRNGAGSVQCAMNEEDIIVADIEEEAFGENARDEAFDVLEDVLLA